MNKDSSNKLKGRWETTIQIDEVLGIRQENHTKTIKANYLESDGAARLRQLQQTIWNQKGRLRHERSNSMLGTRKGS